MDSKVIVTDTDVYGFEILSPEFKPEIKVKFAQDISVAQKREVRNILDGLEKEPNNQDNYRKYGETIVKMIVLDWNLYDGETKLEISADTIDNKISNRLGKWIMEKATSFFLADKTTTN